VEIKEQHQVGVLKSFTAVGYLKSGAEVERAWEISEEIQKSQQVRNIQDFYV
jgi:hypothetical protein